MEYYIKNGEAPDGPYDMVGIIRKLRNGAIDKDTPLATSLFEEPKPAGLYPELEDFFNSLNEEPAAQAEHSYTPQVRSFNSLLASGLEFFKQNYSVAVFSGIYMVLWLVIGMMFISGAGIISSLLGIALSYFLLGGYFYGIVRYVRGHPVNIPLIVKVTVGSASNMAVVSLLASALLLPALLLTSLASAGAMPVVMPIFFMCLLLVLTLLAFSPLLICDKGLDFWDAVRESVRAVLKNKGQNLGNVFGLVALNFLLCIAMPVVLPITMAALVELYDEYYG